MRKWKEFMESLPEEVTCTKKEVVGKVLIGALIGVIVGMMISPRKNQWFGCYNGSTIPGEQPSGEEEADE